MDISLQELPVYPLYDEMLVTKGTGLTREQVEWLLANGTLYRKFPIFAEQLRRPAQTGEEILQGTPLRYEEMTKYEECIALSTMIRPIGVMTMIKCW